MTVKLIEDAMKTYIVVEDNGIGIFKKIKNDLSLQNEHQSLLELAKGKFTSNPKEHSGSLTYSLDRASDIGKFIETDKDLEDNNFSGTLVLMAMNNNSSNSLKKFLMNIFQVTKIKLFVKLLFLLNYFAIKMKVLFQALRQNAYLQGLINSNMQCWIFLASTI